MPDAAEKSSDGTPERILDAALDLFGERGLNGTTVRDIAARGSVNVAAISYHFGGKEELYREVALSAAGRIDAGVRTRASTLIEAPVDDPAAALVALEALIDAVVDVIVGPEEMRRVARFILREQMQPTAAFESIFPTMTRLHTAGCRLFAAAAGLDPEARETRLRVFMIVGQALFFRIAEAAVLRRMQIQRYDESFLAEVKSLLKENLRAIVAASREQKR